MIMPHACHGDRRLFAGPAGSAGSVRGRAMVDMMSRMPDAARSPPNSPGTNGSQDRSLPRDRLDARDHLVDRLVHRNLFADDAVHSLRPDVLVVDDRELVVLGELEGYRAGMELVVHRLAMTIGLPERPLGR